MNHLDVVTGAVFTNPVAARRAIVYLGRDRLEDLFHMRPSGWISARHDRWAKARPLFTAGNAGSDKQNSLLRQHLRPPRRVRIMRVAAVNQNVTLLKKR